ncbi:MAG: hypothetical protein COB78_08765 [Hyphomicrobiales bacterium]|nr:MAG: hypothetical protein COB78_08765 [Hyphomicrobiales bacterium]
MGGAASSTSNAMDKIIDIAGKMGKPSLQLQSKGETKGEKTENVAEAEPGVVINRRLGAATAIPAFDNIKGGGGDDTITYENSTYDRSQAVIYGGGGDDVISMSSIGDSPHGAFGGDGNDTISISARHAGASGGAGDDVITVAGDYLVSAYGDAGDDVITASGELVSRIEGGQGNDTITVNGTAVGLVSGGFGDDVITVTSENKFDDWSDYDHGTGHVHGYYDGYKNPPIIDGGRGNDVINIDGQARVVHRAGDGQDVITVSDKTEFVTFGKDWFDSVLNLDDANFSYENGELTVTFEGHDDKMTIRAAEGEELSWELTSDRTFMVTVNKAAETSVDAEAGAEVEHDDQTDQADS